ncbi:MAG: hypothetical protein KC421_11880 [Anaerolineales bacterium]|nr:hypothetical protein [Anaerolineales bacterium]
MTDSKAAQIANQADRGLTDISIIMMRIELAMNDPENAPRHLQAALSTAQKITNRTKYIFQATAKESKN